MKPTHQILRKYFDRKRRTAAGASLRSIAKRLDVSPSFLSRILSGQKPLPFSLLKPLCLALDIEQEVAVTLQAAYLPEAAERPKRGKAELESSLEEWDLVNAKSLLVLRQWFYLPILEFTTLENYDGDQNTMARRLGLPPPMVDIAIHEMKGLGLLVEKGGKFVKAKKKLRWTTGKSVQQVRHFHDQMLERAQFELRNYVEAADIENRLITGITLTSTPERVRAMKGKLAECLHEIANELVEEDGSEVFHFATQLFPLTRK
jgi:uncharacterized protein (TIGR02147 family)